MNTAERFWIGTSWKMNKTLAEATDYARALKQSRLFQDQRLQGFIIPPFTALAAVCREVGDFPVVVGAQNMCWADRGAFTGEVSPVMIKDCGATLVELGHSERRQMFGETDETVNRKVRAALAHGLVPLICVGETAAEKGFGAAAETVVRQTRIALHGVEGGDLKRVLVAYEPVWAIGEHGTPATPDYADWIHQKISAALPVPVLYGGSVDETNSLAFAELPSVAGLFIGRSAWSVDGYLRIVEKVTRVRFKA
ncbi:MAG: triose-phosphate isomerase [Pseudomonadota bacterium]|nr:triose-phosphate isomerase [Pseudomonadota bacterium]